MYPQQIAGPQRPYLPNIASVSLTIKDIIQANENIANNTSSKFVNKSIPGTIIEIKGKKFEIRFFSFENTTNILKENTKFKDYIKQNNLLKLETIVQALSKEYFLKALVLETQNSRIKYILVYGLELLIDIMDEKTQEELRKLYGAITGKRANTLEEIQKTEFTP